jgi:hypothetical protein
MLDAVAGAAGALLALLTTYPLMTLNTRQHTTHEEKRADPPPSGGTPKRSILDDLRALAREEGGGVGALYRGIEPAVIGTVTSQAVYNWWYAKLRGSYARKYGENPGALGSLAVAAAAGSVNVLMTIPIWTVCVRMQAERAGADGEKRQDAGDDAAEGKKTRTRWGRGTAARARDGTGRRSSAAATGSNPAATGAGAVVFRKKTFFETTRAVWEESGASGFWRGVVPSIAMVANPALQYAFYESVADRFRRAKGRRRRVTSEGGSRARPLDRGGILIRLGGVRGGFRGEGLRDDADVPGASREVAAAGGGRGRGPEDAIRRGRRRGAEDLGGGGVLGVLPRDGHEDDPDRLRRRAHVRREGRDREIRAKASAEAVTYSQGESVETRTSAGPLSVAARTRRSRRAPRSSTKNMRS